MTPLHCPVSTAMYSAVYLLIYGFGRDTHGLLFRIVMWQSDADLFGRPVFRHHLGFDVFPQRFTDHSLRDVAPLADAGECFPMRSLGIILATAFAWLAANLTRDRTLVSAQFLRYLGHRLVVLAPSHLDDTPLFERKGACTLLFLCFSFAHTRPAYLLTGCCN